MFVKCRSGENGNGSQGTERFFFLEQKYEKNPLSVYAHLS
jgi:hypothetical protein